jgi:hypothetical protein
METVVTGLVGLALARMLREILELRYPAVAAGLELRKGQRPMLALLTLLCWAAAAVLLLVIAAELALEGIQSSILGLTQLAGLGFAAAAAGGWLAETWWRTTAPSR